MITVKGTGRSPSIPQNPEGINLLRRRLSITDKNGVEHEIRTQADLKRILAQMSPEERSQWETNYRFAPVHNLTKNPYYCGTGGDLD